MKKNRLIILIILLVIFVVAWFSTITALTGVKKINEQKELLAQAEGLAPAARCSLRLSVCLPHPSSSRRNCGGVTRTGVTGDRRRTSGDTGIRTAA